MRRRLCGAAFCGLMLAVPAGAGADGLPVIAAALLALLATAARMSRLDSQRVKP